MVRMVSTARTINMGRTASTPRIISIAGNTVKMISTIRTKMVNTAIIRIIRQIFPIRFRQVPRRIMRQMVSRLPDLSAVFLQSAPAAVMVFRD